MRVLALVVAAIATLGLGSCDREQRDSETLPFTDIGSLAGWADKQGFADNAQAVRGAQIFAQVGCLNCHTYLGDGTQNLGAPDLTAIGRENSRSPGQYAAYVSDPSMFGNQVMPRFEDLGERRLLAVGTFLAASKGER